MEAAGIPRMTGRDSAGSGRPPERPGGNVSIPSIHRRHSDKIRRYYPGFRAVEGNEFRNWQADKSENGGDHRNEVPGCLKIPGFVAGFGLDRGLRRSCRGRDRFVQRPVGQVRLPVHRRRHGFPPEDRRGTVRQTAPGHEQPAGPGRGPGQFLQSDLCGRRSPKKPWSAASASLPWPRSPPRSGP